MKIKRKNEELKRQERNQQKLHKRIKRGNEEFRETERIQETCSKRIKRKNKEFKRQEKHQQRKRKEERNSIKFKNAENITNQEYKRRLRLSEIYSFRENYIKILKTKRDPISKAKLKFIKKRQDTPNNTCACCETLWFSHSVVNLSNSKGHSKLTDNIFQEKIINDKTTSKICRTCDKNIKNGKIPQLATSNGLKFPFVPKCVTTLSDVEAVMVSPLVAFKQIRPLKPYSLNPQLSLKGSVVHIPVDINEMINVLPRPFTSLDITQIIFKRNISHKSEYMNEFVRPPLICEALEYLVNTPLYKKCNIKVDKKLFEQYEKCSDIHFITDEKDKEHINKSNTCKQQIVNDGDGKISYALESETDIEEEISNEVLLLDRNAECAKLAEVIAPGQANKPVSNTSFKCTMPS